MTDYGRGSGSEPWHPEDPLFGDQGWAAQQATDAGAPYGGPQHQQHQQHQQQQFDQQQHQQQYAQQPQQQPSYGGGQDPYQQQYAQQQYATQQYADPQQYGGAQQYGNGNGQYDGAQQQPQQQPQHQHQQQFDQQAQQQQQQAQQQQSQPQQQPQQGQYADPQYNDPQYNGGWDAGQQAEMPYAGTPSGPYTAQQETYGESPDPYATPDAYPPPQPPGRRRAEPEPEPEAEQAAAGKESDGPEKESHPFLTGDDGDGGGDGKDADTEDEGRGGRRNKQKKGRNGVACLVVAVVFLGGAGGVGYVGYQFWESKFGPPPDYSGVGSGSVQVEIPQGAGGYEIGAILVKNGVVKSQRAFVSATKNNPKGNTLQAGVYTLSKEMSAANAVKTMLSPSSRNALIIPEGRRNVQIYAMIDKQLGLAEGSTEKVAKKETANLGLPKWAKNGSPIKDPLEGFLFPASYPVAKGTKPEAVLKKMVARANSEYTKLDLVGNAKKHDLAGPWELLTAASLVQAEGKTHDDFRKMAEVIYNRLKPDNTETNQFLQFDSTFNYLKGQSEIDISVAEITKNQDPYNSYTHKGLTPGPIGNPGEDALAAVLNPTEDGWIYFVATDGQDKTEFAKNYDEFLLLKDKFDGRNKGN
ncbi:endolytic transglycosylase MltG [Streptomyces paludis]|uniref:Endolytic murein transglycosylase n=1 Tax=Streptomyces paludis TaxID=2282738 RepID=A0A345HJK1_9ACTN|nr:endolytic transglycosylase MltG [Streptomyces paludis]AXG76875.1 endolytic transglycosylase MltG [Streptomyces paludis]